jgi:hypothetical protein
VNEIPGALDWARCTDDPDCSLVYEKFFGKSNGEIQGFLNENFIMRCLDWGLMSNEPFNYYFGGFKIYLDSKRGDSEELGFSIARVLDAIDSHFEDHPEIHMDFWRNHESSIQFFENIAHAIKPLDEARDEILQRMQIIRNQASGK